METSRIRHVLNSLMILSFLIFGLLAGVMLLLDVPLTNASVALPFSFLFISLITLISTARIEERPKLADKYLREWLVICIFGSVLGALAFAIG
jgi:hypothetical protein